MQHPIGAFPTVLPPPPSTIASRPGVHVTVETERHTVTPPSSCCRSPPESSVNEPFDNQDEEIVATLYSMHMYVHNLVST